MAVAAVAALLLLYNAAVLGPGRAARAAAQGQEARERELLQARQQLVILEQRQRQLQREAEEATVLREERAGLERKTMALESTLADNRALLKSLQSLAGDRSSEAAEQVMRSLQAQLEATQGRLQQSEEELAQERRRAAMAANVASLSPPSSLASGEREGGARAGGPIAILLVCYNRPDYLRQTIQNLLELRPSAEEFPIVVSQDGTDARVWELVAGEFGEEVVAIQHYARRPLKTVYHNIAEHYRFALTAVFDKLSFSSVVILEDDMRVSPDFFSYFRAMRRLLHDDRHETLYAASAWNDNGIDGLVGDPYALRRSDFFGGLGWMITAQLWAELGPKWPEGWWDDWMREPAQRRGRSVIHPEIARSYTFGEKGSSGGQFWAGHLQHIRLHDEPVVDFEALDLSYLSQSEWDVYLGGLLYNAVPAGGASVSLDSLPQGMDIVYEYNAFSDFQQLARKFGLMTDEKAGVPRTAYKGVVYFRESGRLVFIAPSDYREAFNLR